MKEYRAKKFVTFREKVIGTVLILVLFRLVSHIPLPFINAEYIGQLLENNSALTFFNAMTGGSFEEMSILALGITPYITASIVTQLMGVVIPRLAEMQKEGSTGQRTIEKINIVLAACLAFMQSVFMLWGYGSKGLLTPYKWYIILFDAVLMTVGVFLLSFAGQMISRHFFGNGISLILATGILASYLADANHLFVMLKGSDRTPVQVAVYCGIAFLAVLLLFAFTYWLTFCEKRIHVTYSRKISTADGINQMMAQKQVIPLKMIAGSVVPIIFASSILTLPSIIQSYTGTDVKWLWMFDMGKWFNPARVWPSVGVIFYCAMIIWFSYYYNNLNLNEVELSNNLKKQGGYINGIRPGKPTELYLKDQMFYLTLIGAFGLCIIAIVPAYVTAVLTIPRLSFMGTSIIITVSVIKETWDAFQAERKSRIYVQSDLFPGVQNVSSVFGKTKYGHKKGASV